MTGKERLEEIKAQYHSLTRNGYDLGAWDEPFSWLIKRVQELEDIIYRDARQDVLEGLYEENKHYRETIKSVRSEIKYALYSNKSEDVKRHYLQNAEREATEALEGEGE